MLFFDVACVNRTDGSTKFRWVKPPTSAEFTDLAHRIAVGLQTRRNVFTLQKLPVTDTWFNDQIGKVGGLATCWSGGQGR